jgi:hypothetical protein
MADDKNLKLNSLDRYTKQSPRLILEEYSHCEVPAGCGGVVLRWRDPAAGVPVEFLLYATSKSRSLTIDGVEKNTSRPLLPAGKHVLGLHLTEVNPSAGFLLLTAVYRSRGTARVGKKADVHVHFSSSSDGTWKFTTSEPADSTWQTLTFDDADWLPLQARAMDIPKERNHLWSHFRQDIAKFGGQELGFPTNPTGLLDSVRGLLSSPKGDTVSVWIRKEFTILPETHPLSLGTE